MGLFDKDIVKKSVITAEAIRERIQNKPPALSHHPSEEELDVVIESVLESIYYSVNIDAPLNMSWEFPVRLFGILERRWIEEEERLPSVLQKVVEDNNKILSYVSHRLESLGFECLVEDSTIIISLPFDERMLNEMMFNEISFKRIAPKTITPDIIYYNNN